MRPTAYALLVGLLINLVPVSLAEEISCSRFQDRRSKAQCIAATYRDSDRFTSTPRLFAPGRQRQRQVHGGECEADGGGQVLNVDSSTLGHDAQVPTGKDARATLHSEGF